MVSSFTGRVPAINSGALVTGDVPAASAQKDGGTDPGGLMTSGVGTLLWMAPESYRGDRDYGTAVRNLRGHTPVYRHAHCH